LPIILIYYKPIHLLSNAIFIVVGIAAADWIHFCILRYHQARHLAATHLCTLSRYTAIRVFGTSS